MVARFPQFPGVVDSDTVAANFGEGVVDVEP